MHCIVPCFVGRGFHLLKFPNFMETLGNETSCEDKVWLAGHGDNDTCIIQVKICPLQKNMPALKKHKGLCIIQGKICPLEKNMPPRQKNAFLANSIQYMSAG